MNDIDKNDLTLTISKIVSVVFHPLLMPMYGMLIILFAPTLFVYLPSDVKRLILLIILINNILLPSSLLPYFKYRNVITTWTVEDRRERTIPLLITTLLYAATTYIIFQFPVPVFLKSFTLASFFISLCITIINLWWKISIHSAGAGALLSIIIILSLKMYGTLTWYLIAVILSSGLVLTARLRLNSHNPVEVWVGFLTGFFGLGLYMWFF